MRPLEREERRGRGKEEREEEEREGMHVLVAWIRCPSLGVPEWGARIRPGEGLESPGTLEVTGGGSLAMTRPLEPSRPPPGLPLDPTELPQPGLRKSLLKLIWRNSLKMA